MAETIEMCARIMASARALILPDEIWNGKTVKEDQMATPAFNF